MAATTRATTTRAARGHRRARNLIVALTASAALVAAGCGSDSSEETTSSTAKAAGCQSGSESGTRVIKDTFLGDVEAPVTPQRIVAGWLVGNQLLDLGVPLVGLLDDYKQNATQEELDKAKDLPTVGSISDGLSAEKTLSLKPDLVVTSIRKDIVETLAVEKLKDKVPVAAFGILEPADVWRNYTKVADAVGCGDKVTADLKRLDTELAQIGTTHKDTIAKLGEVAYVEGSAVPGSFQIATSKALTYERLTKAGLTYFSGADPNPERYNHAISLELTSKLEPANVIFYEADFDGKPTKRTQELLDKPTFKNLPAVKAGNLFPYPAPYAYTITAADKQVEAIESAVKAAKPAATP